VAQASRNVRKIRKLKRQRTMLLRMTELALNQRDQARVIATATIKELAKMKEPETAIKVVEDAEQELSEGTQAGVGTEETLGS